MGVEAPDVEVTEAVGTCKPHWVEPVPVGAVGIGSTLSDKTLEGNVHPVVVFVPMQVMD
jgi:hypothetical protein